MAFYQGQEKTSVAAQFIEDIRGMESNAAVTQVSSLCQVKGRLW
jgi:hypothetical protein